MGSNLKSFQLLFFPVFGLYESLSVLVLHWPYAMSRIASAAGGTNASAVIRPYDTFTLTKCFGSKKGTHSGPPFDVEVSSQ